MCMYSVQSVGDVVVNRLLSIFIFSNDQLFSSVSFDVNVLLKLA